MDMNSRLYNLTRILGIITLSFLVSCQDTIPKRSLISSGSTVTTPECTEGQELVTETDETTGETTQVCKDVEFKRPAGVTWKTDFCICKDGKPISYGNCSTFCSTKNTSGAEILYANFNLSAEITLNDELGNLYNWCQKVIDTDTANPACAIQAKDELGNVTLINEVTVSSTSNSLTTNVQNLLSYDKTYVLTLIEKTSGVKSDSIQMIKFSQDMSLPILGPLKNVPISQYSCIVKEFSQIDGNNIDNAYRLHYYFNPRLAPDPIPAGSPVYCHDYMNPLYGSVDKDGYPRLETIPGTFNLWDETDPRFYDNNGNTLIDINEAIVQKTKNFGATIPSSSKFFYTLPWSNGPQFETTEGTSASTMKSLGYFMAPWIDQSTFKSYCLTNTHYNSTNALFKALRDYIGVETEGLYVGVKAAETLTNKDNETVTGVQDAILIRESDLKAVWFYYKNGVPTAPTEDNVASNTIYFYYPLNKTSPFVRSSTQKIFRVKSATELASGTSSSTTTPGSTSGGSTTSYPPHDRKIGCIPKF
jgi:hypothetical protein